VGKDRLEILESFMPQLLSFFENGKPFSKVVEKLNPKTQRGLGVNTALIRTYSSLGLAPCEGSVLSR
jgi:hypothetical protein